MKQIDFLLLLLLLFDVIEINDHPCEVRFAYKGSVIN